MEPVKTVKVRCVTFYDRIDVPTVDLYDIARGDVIEVTPEVAARLHADHFEIEKVKKEGEAK